MRLNSSSYLMVLWLMESGQNYITLTIYLRLLAGSNFIKVEDKCRVSTELSVHNSTLASFLLISNSYILKYIKFVFQHMLIQTRYYITLGIIYIYKVLYRYYIRYYIIYIYYLRVILIYIIIRVYTIL